jgi:hypothetical protein
MSERRAEPRKFFMCSVELELTDGAQPVTLTGRQEDISSGGTGIWVKKPVAVGTRVRIRRRGGEEVLGTVQQCRPDGFGHFIGIRYQQDAAEPGAASPKS